MAATTITNGHVQAHEKLTARFYFQPTGGSGFIDLGNVADYKVATERQTKTHMRALYGYRLQDDEQVDTEAFKYEGTLTEVSAETQEMLALGTAGANNTVSATTAPSGTATITDVVKGRTYFIGATALNTLVATKTPSTLVLGTDYTVDLNAGTIVFLTTGVTVSDGDDVDLTFGNAARTFQNWTTGDNPLFRGTGKILEYNQHSREPLREISGSANFIVTSFQEQSGEFAKYVVRISFTSPPTVKRRQGEA